MLATVVARYAARKIDASSFSAVIKSLGPITPVVNKTTGMKISLGDCDFL